MLCIYVGYTVSTPLDCNTFKCFKVFYNTIFFLTQLSELAFDSSSSAVRVAVFQVGTSYFLPNQLI